MTTTANADAYLIDDGWESVIVDAGMETDEAFDGQTPIPLLLLASFDHGLRTADETNWAVGTECVGQVCRAFFVACGVPFDSAPIDWSAIGEDMGWSDVTGWLVNLDDSQALHYWCTYEAEPMFSDAGGIVETSADAGMTWLYIPVS